MAISMAARNMPVSALTWMDIARTLNQLEPTSPEWSGRPKGLVRGEVDWTSATFELTDLRADASGVVAWLTAVFPRRVIPTIGNTYFLLDGPNGAHLLPIEFVESAGEGLEVFNLGTVNSTIDFRETVKVERIASLPLIACHSVKGGTGRTTTAVALAIHLAGSMGQKVLLVDADLEAPGLSYLFRNARGEPSIGLEDLVALAHSDESNDREVTVKFVAERLADHRFENGLVALPLRRDLEDLESSSIRAEHLASPSHPFALADLLRDVARAAGCGAVVVDVRAGLVPIATQLILDPTALLVFTTTVSGQSLEATAALMRFVARSARRRGEVVQQPLIVFNRIPSVMRETEADEALIRPFLDAATKEFLRGQASEVSSEEDVFQTETAIEAVSVARIAELSDLQAGSGDWDRFTAQLDTSGFARSLSETLDTWLEQAFDQESAGEEPTLPRDQGDSESRRQLLAVAAERLVAAETSDDAVENPLITHPLQMLATQFQSQLPIVVAEGAKGTGKTLSARFLVNKQTWKNAALALAASEPTIDAEIVPVFGSIQSSEKYQSEIADRRVAASRSLGYGAPQRIDQTRQALLRLFPAALDAEARVELWLDAIAWSVGFECDMEGAGSRLIEGLRKSGRSLLAVVEGIEELYTDPFAPDAQAAFRSLIVDLPQRLRGEPGRPIGLCVFARRDSVASAVPQNLDQFRRTYKDFELSWSEQDLLELAAWLATEAGSLDIWTPKFRTYPQIEKERRLFPLWGRKLGRDDKPGKRTAEAYTANWVVAVLSDLQSRLVARDLVRFLANAAAHVPAQLDRDMLATRLLVPRALKDAVKPTSIAKVQETEEEISELKPVFNKFRASPDAVVAPLDADALATLQLDSDDIKLLRRHGIIFGDAPPYEVPELFRMGLNLRHSGARHSVINLRRKARQRFGQSV